MTLAMARTRALEPFGVEVLSETPWTAFDIDEMRALVAAHRVVVVRRQAPQSASAFEAACARWGALLAWNFGYVLDLQVHDVPQNYLFTNGKVPLHWDGAFAAQVPSLQCFQCLEAPPAGAGGETVFCDTVRTWRDASADTQAIWRAVTFHYRTERVAHYGGAIEAPLVARHPHSGETVLRFAEPPDEATAPLNPLSVDVPGMSTAALCEELCAALYDPSHMLAHRWAPGDVLFADNHALLHGRHPFLRHAPRHLQRVHIL